MAVPGLDPGIRPGHPRLALLRFPKTWMAGTRPSMTMRQRSGRLGERLWDQVRDGHDGETLGAFGTDAVASGRA